MANTIKNTQILLSERKVIQYITLSSDGTNETATVIYDSSTVATTAGKADPLNSAIYDVKYVSATPAGKVSLLWDATTDVLAFSMGSNTIDMCFDKIGGLKNTSGTGKTGDILLTTTGLAAGDSFTIILTVYPSFV